MCISTVIPGMDPESRLFNKGGISYLPLDSWSTLCPGMTQRGFTLIELLVVVLIIGILAAVALPQYEKAVEKSRAAEALTLLSAIAKAEEVYYMASGEYAGDFDKLDIGFPQERQSYYGSSNAVKTKNFVCRPHSVQSGAWQDAVAVCSRIPTGSLYAFAQLKDGRRVCRWYSDKGLTYCKMFGSASGSEVTM